MTFRWQPVAGPILAVAAIGTGVLFAAACGTADDPYVAPPPLKSGLQSATVQPGPIVGNLVPPSPTWDIAGEQIKRTLPPEVFETPSPTTPSARPSDIEVGETTTPRPTSATTPEAAIETTTPETVSTTSETVEPTTQRKPPKPDKPDSDDEETPTTRSTGLPRPRG